MIVVDTSVWVDHFRLTDQTLAHLLTNGEVLTHAFVIGELALGNMRQRETILGSLRDLPKAPVAADAEVLVFIEECSLAGMGIGYVDVHLLASTRLAAGATLWTRDKYLLRAAEQLGLATRP